jgi:integrase
VAETDVLTRLLRADDRAVALDLPDLADWTLATGARIGEALALRYATNAEGRPVLDLDAGTWEVNATVVRIPGHGLVVQPRPKTAAGWRVIAIPQFAVRMIQARPMTSSAVFAAPVAGGAVAVCGSLTGGCDRESGNQVEDALRPACSGQLGVARDQPPV